MEPRPVRLGGQVGENPLGPPGARCGPTGAAHRVAATSVPLQVGHHLQGQVITDGQIELISDTPRKEFVYRAIDIYASAGNYRTAEQYGQVLILPLASFFSEQDVRKTLEAVLGNSQISYGSGTPDVVLELFKLTHGLIEQTRPHWQAFVG